MLIAGLTDNWDDGADVGAITLQIDRAVSELATISIDRSIKRIVSAKVRAHAEANGEDAGLSGDDWAGELPTEALRLLRAEHEGARVERIADPEPQSDVPTCPEEREGDDAGTGAEPPSDADGVELDEVKGTIK